MMQTQRDHETRKIHRARNVCLHIAVASRPIATSLCHRHPASLEASPEAHHAALPPASSITKDLLSAIQRTARNDQSP